MKLRQNSLNLLLALSLALSSVMSAHHVHAHDLDHSDGDQIEQCLAFHQLHFDGQAQYEYFQLAYTLDIFHAAKDLCSESATDLLLPPARGPPAFS